MSKNKYINIPKIGDVLFEKSRKAKGLIISVKSPSCVRVAVPRFISIKKAESYVYQKLDWIITQQNKLSNKVNILELITSTTPDEKLKIVMQTKKLAEKYNYTFNKLTIRKMRTRWGSCTSKNNISLNIGLVALPDDLREYIILHELLHTRIKNHSKEFWNKLGNLIPNPKALNRKLSQNYGLYEI